MSRVSPAARLDRWLDRWGEIVPLLLAEFIVWLGFGALLPVLPLYFTEQGVDLAFLGVVIAAWPAARLVGEPIFGWLADRTARVPLMVIGLVATGVFSILPLVFTGPLAFLLLRAGAGLSTAVYDPAARGYLTDATPPERRGEAFGLYGAVQMGGLLLGPAIGALGAGWFGGISFVFVFGGIAAWVAAVPIGLRGRETGQRTHPGPSPDATEFPSEAPVTSRRAAIDIDADRAAHLDPAAPTRLWNRGLIAVLVINAGGYFAGGTYEVIWSLFLQHLGAGLDLIGFTFAMFGLPVLLLSPFAGRLVDRRGSLAFIVIGSMLPAVVGDRLHADHGPAHGRAADPGRGDRLRDAQPGALFGRGGELAAGPVIDGAGPLRRGRDRRVHRGVARRRGPRQHEHRLPALRLQRGAGGEPGARAGDRRAAAGGAGRGARAVPATSVAGPSA